MNRRRRVLVVEDDRAVSDLISTVLESDGYEVVVAADGLAGLIKLSALKPDCIVLDIMMPNIGGIRVLQELVEEHSEVPVIVVTGKPEAAAEARRRIGAENVFDKPFDIEALVTRVGQLTEEAE